MPICPSAQVSFIYLSTTPSPSDFQIPEKSLAAAALLYIYKLECPFDWQVSHTGTMDRKKYKKTPARRQHALWHYKQWGKDWANVPLNRQRTWFRVPSTSCAPLVWHACELYSGLPAWRGLFSSVLNCNVQKTLRAHLGTENSWEAHKLAE
jgi:hypothetical protein